mgnify:CR=1 FL=1
MADALAAAVEAGIEKEVSLPDWPETHEEKRWQE